MSLEQALEELKKYSKEFESIGNAKEYIKENNQDFIHRYTKVMQYYNYISKNAGMTDIWFEAVNIICDISSNNPSLEDWTEKIINGVTIKEVQTKENNESLTDSASLSNKINSYITEIKEITGKVSYDPEELEDIEWQLQKCQEELINSKNSIDENKFNSMMNQITIALEEIERRREILSSIHM